LLLYVTFELGFDGPRKCGLLVASALGIMGMAGLRV
jgi:hypothetical protein